MAIQPAPEYVLSRPEQASHSTRSRSDVALRFATKKHHPDPSLRFDLYCVRKQCPNI